MIRTPSTTDSSVVTLCVVSFCLYLQASNVVVAALHAAAFTSVAQALIQARDQWNGRTTRGASGVRLPAASSADHDDSFQIISRAEAAIATDAASAKVDGIGIAPAAAVMVGQVCAAYARCVK